MAPSGAATTSGSNRETECADKHEKGGKSLKGVWHLKPVLQSITLFRAAARIRGVAPLPCGTVRFRVANMRRIGVTFWQKFLTFRISSKQFDLLPERTLPQLLMDHYWSLWISDCRGLADLPEES
jgi:hypothetical protein